MIRSLPHTDLTARDRGMIVTAGGSRIGCTVALANGFWAAWTLAAKLGEYETQDEATSAVLAASRAKKKASP